MCRAEFIAAGRIACPDGPRPANRIDTSSRLYRLRRFMNALKIQAYVITSDDEHKSEYVCPADKRRMFMSGVSGSSGTAIVTRELAALWTDGRYHLQADQQLDCNWLLMRSGIIKVPKEIEWLGSVLTPGDRVRADAKLNSATTRGIHLKNVVDDLVDVVWNDAKRFDEKPARPDYKAQSVYIHNLTNTGQLWEDKVRAMRSQLEKPSCDAVVVTALDEIAWLLNLRGSDMIHCPLFKSYTYLLLDDVVLFVDRAKFT